MGKPAARITDMHVCPMVTPGTPPIPHVGGPILPPGAPTVLIGGIPAARMGDMCVCTGPPDSIILGSTGVLIGGKPAARMGDSTSHGGSVVIGSPNVLIGEAGGGAAGKAVSVQAAQIILAAAKNMKGDSGPAAKQVALHMVAAAKGEPFVHHIPTCPVCSQNQSH